jgi:hypothetical protein
VSGKSGRRRPFFICLILLFLSLRSPLRRPVDTPLSTIFRNLDRSEGFRLRSCRRARLRAGVRSLLSPCGAVLAARTHGWASIVTGIVARVSNGYIRDSQIANTIVQRVNNQQVTLKPQDVVVLLKLLVSSGRVLPFSALAGQLAMSASEVHASVGRAMEARLVNVASDRLQVTKAALKEFLLHGAKYAFPATFGAATRGVPTAYAAPPLVTLVSQPDELPPVWPDPSGDRRGMALYPLYPTVPRAARADPALYECLALFDALRSGAARERQIAGQLLSEKFK